MHSYRDNNTDKETAYTIGSDLWLLRETTGSRLFDKFFLNLLKMFYLGSRVIVRILLGRKTRDKLWIKKNISFKDFLYRSIEFLKLDKILLLEFYIPKYGFKFYSRVTSKVNNFLIDDMYKSMHSHEDDVIEYFIPSEGDIVVDVGAAFGFYSILASEKVKEKGRVIAIEPQPDSFNMLNLNIRLNHLTNITTLNYAVYSKETTLKLYDSYSTLPERSVKNKTDYIEIKANSLDYLVNEMSNIRKIDWIKIDVEGAELEVLKGAHNILSENKNMSILIEIHGKDKFTSIVNLLNDYGFERRFEKDYDWGDKHVIFHKVLT